jgi:hypothetical protein
MRRAGLTVVMMKADQSKRPTDAWKGIWKEIEFYTAGNKAEWAWQ